MLPADRNPMKSRDLAAGCVAIGRIRTPYKTSAECPRNVQDGGAICTLEINDEFADGLLGLEKHEYIQVLYWLHEAKRNLLRLPRGEDGSDVGVFALRSPTRPNPIASSVVKLVAVEGNTVRVEGLDCVDGTPLLDIKRATVGRSRHGEKTG